MSKHVSKVSCRSAGHVWTGTDISGHCFLLTFNCLVILEEVREVTRQFKVRDSLLCDVTTCLLHWLVVLWEGMMLATSLYFHTEPEKVCGVLCAIVPWAAIYRGKLLQRISTVLQLLLKYCDIVQVLVPFQQCILLNHRCDYY